jgi:hypothetical protein
LARTREAILSASANGRISRLFWLLRAKAALLAAAPGVFVASIDEAE